MFSKIEIYTEEHRNITEEVQIEVTFLMLIILPLEDWMEKSGVVVCVRFGPCTTHSGPCPQNVNSENLIYVCQ